MIGFKTSILRRLGGKDGQTSAKKSKLHLQIVLSLRRIILLSASKVHNIVKRFQESGEVSVRTGQSNPGCQGPSGSQVVLRESKSKRDDSLMKMTELPDVTKLVGKETSVMKGVAARGKGK